MTIPEFKKVGRLLIEAYKELDSQALKEGLDIFGEQYVILKDKVREGVLAKMGFTLEEYRLAKDELAAANKNQTRQALTELQTQIDSLKTVSVPTVDQIKQIADETAKQYVVAPVITNQIVKETIVKEPTIVKETKIEQITNHVPFDPAPIHERVNNLARRIDEIKIPEPVNIQAIKEDVKLDFGAMLKENINVLDMPDWRKLAMGLQGQIDALPKSVSTFTFSTGLTNTSGTVTANISTGVTGGQTIIGGTGASEGLSIKLTTGAGVGNEFLKIFGGNNGNSLVAQFSLNQITSLKNHVFAQTTVFNGLATFQNSVQMGTALGEVVHTFSNTLDDGFGNLFAQGLNSVFQGGLNDYSSMFFNANGTTIAWDDSAYGSSTGYAAGINMPGFNSYGTLLGIFTPTLDFNLYGGSDRGLTMAAYHQIVFRGGNLGNDNLAFVPGLGQSYNVMIQNLTDSVGLIVIGESAQTSDLQQWAITNGGAGENDFSQTVVASVNYLGQATFDNVTLPGTATHTLMFNSSATAPSTTTGVVATTHYGSGTNYLGTPNAWVIIRVAGLNFKVPAYS